MEMDTELEIGVMSPILMVINEPIRIVRKTEDKNIYGNIWMEMRQSPRLQWVYQLSNKPNENCFLVAPE